VFELDRLGDELSGENEAEQGNHNTAVPIPVDCGGCHSAKIDYIDTKQVVRFESRTHNREITITAVVSHGNETPSDPVARRPRGRHPSRGVVRMSDDDEESLFGAISILGAISLCCIGLGTTIGGAVLIGGVGGAAGAGTTTAVVGSASARGAVVSLLVTLLTVVAIALVVQWRLQ